MKEEPAPLHCPQRPRTVTHRPAVCLASRWGPGGNPDVPLALSSFSHTSPQDKLVMWSIHLFRFKEGKVSPLRMQCAAPGCVLGTRGPGVGVRVARVAPSNSTVHPGPLAEAPGRGPPPPAWGLISARPPSWLLVCGPYPDASAAGNSEEGRGPRA